MTAKQQSTQIANFFKVIRRKALEKVPRFKIHGKYDRDKYFSECERLIKRDDSLSVTQKSYMVKILQGQI